MQNRNNELPQQQEKFRDKYRIKSTRLKNWDYSSNGAYFITVCARNREYCFGEIIDKEMRLSEIGQIVAKEWQNTKQIRKNVKIDEWIVMPNHLHGIILINGSVSVEHCNASLPDAPYVNLFGPQSNNVSAIIRGFKGASTKNIHIFGYAGFFWQPRFYDHIIRDENELNRIREYIFNNPLNWDLDKNNSENLYM